MNTPATLTTVDAELSGADVDRLPIGSAVVLVRDHRNRDASAPSALLRVRDGSWRASDCDDTGPLNTDAVFRVLYLGADT